MQVIKIGWLILRLLMICLVISCGPNLTLTQELIRGPYLQLGTPTSIQVCWETQSKHQMKLKYGTEPDALSFQKVTEDSVVAGCLPMENLQPASKYFYELHTSDSMLVSGEDVYAQSHPDSGSRGKYRFWVMGDFGTGEDEQKQVRDAFKSFNERKHLDGFVMLGDNAYESGKESEFTHYLFAIYPEILAKTLAWPAMGNHDARTNDGAPYFRAFYLPDQGQSGGVPSNSEHYYSWDYGNIHFICLDSELSSRKKSGAQYQWLEQDLQATKQEWIIAYWHHPPYTFSSHNSDRENKHYEMREVFNPLLEQYGVDMVFGGHSHDYERSFLIDSAYGNSTENLARIDEIVLDNGSGNPDEGEAYKKNGVYEGHKGTIYSVVGSGGKLSSSGSLHPVMYVQHKKRGSVLLEIEGLTADIRFIDDNGDVLDHMRLVQEPATILNRIENLSGQYSSKSFHQNQRTLRFADGNNQQFQLYNQSGELLLRKIPKGILELKKEKFPDGDYFFRFGKNFGRISISSK